MKKENTNWLDPEKWRPLCMRAEESDVERAFASASPGIREFTALISPAAAGSMERMAQKAQALTRKHFGRTISLYVPLYLSNYCSGGCVYCGFASDRKQPRRRLEPAELRAEISALKKKGFEDVLLLTGERVFEADFNYLLNCVRIAAQVFHNISVEAFAMTSEEYEQLAQAGCTGITLYQETYDRVLYSKLHRWGEKRHYDFRLDAPGRALEGGLRSAGIGVLLGLGDPIADAICLFQHAAYLRKKFWKAGVMVSFPRICAQYGSFKPLYKVDDRMLAQLIFAFRICFPDMPLVLSTREMAKFRDGIAGIGISRMSIASRTTVGGYYHQASKAEKGQFDVSDTRNVKTFCKSISRKGLEPVFKNWESLFRLVK